MKFCAPTALPHDFPQSSIQTRAESFDLERFLTAQEGDFERARRELANGAKRSCWIWYIFPQTITARTSAMSKRYAILQLADAAAYLRHPVLGRRLTELTQIVLSHTGRSAQCIMGDTVDAQKLQSSMTLFALISDRGSLFHRVLDAFYDGQPCKLTLQRFGYERLPNAVAEAPIPERFVRPETDPCDGPHRHRASQPGGSALPGARGGRAGRYRPGGGAE
jgi:uncharacterized protein (DUF1810 family)